MIKLRAEGAEALIARLRNIATRVPDKARKTMHRGADRIVQEARLNTPVDRYNLESAIHKRIAYEDDWNGRLKIDIVVDGTVGGVNVERYAIIVHENYEGMLVKGPGPGTLAKMKANPGRRIGSKFLERALEKEREKLARDMIEAINGELA